jgi:hypothetical protein
MKMDLLEGSQNVPRPTKSRRNKYNQQFHTQFSPVLFGAEVSCFVTPTVRLRHAGANAPDCQPRREPGVARSRFGRHVRFLCELLLKALGFPISRVGAPRRLYFERPFEGIGTDLALVARLNAVVLHRESDFAPLKFRSLDWPGSRRAAHIADATERAGELAAVQLEFEGIPGGARSTGAKQRENRCPGHTLFAFFRSWGLRAVGADAPTPKKERLSFCVFYPGRRFALPWANICRPYRTRFDFGLRLAICRSPLGGLIQLQTEQAGCQMIVIGDAVV